jgi:hypothetical protein
MQHDEILNDLESRLLGCYLSVKKNKTYQLSKETSGEMDIYAIDFNKKRVIVVEVKEKDTKTNHHKAKVQLKKDLIFFYSTDYSEFDFKIFYAYSDSNSPRGYNTQKVRLEDLTPLKIFKNKYKKKEFIQEDI